MFYPYVSPGAIDRVSQTLQDRWIGQGALVDEFEKALEQTFGLKHVVAVNASSSALRLALSIVGVSPGDEVITTPLTCTLTNHPIIEQFAKPVFADIQPDTGNIDPTDIEHRITPRTKAILCTHWGGMPPDLAELQGIASQFGLPVIEDASEALGAIYAGKPVGTISQFTAFSFQAVQTLTTGEGGALVSTSEAFSDQARVQRWYGIDRKHRTPNQMGYYDFDITLPGFGYHMTNIAAALGLEGLKALPALQLRRVAIAAQYRSALKNVNGLTLLREQIDRESSSHFFTINVERRDDFFRMMKSNKIEVSVVHYRNDAYTMFGGLRSDLPCLDRFSETYIALPTHAGLTEEDIHRIIAAVQGGW